MKTVRFEKNEIEDQFEKCNNLKEIIEDVEKSGHPSGQYVCRINVNGLGIGEEDEVKFATTRREDINDLEIVFGSLEELVSGLLKSYVLWIPNIKRVLLDTANHFQAGDLEKGQKSFIVMLDSCRYYINSLIELKRASKEISESVFVEEHFAALIREIMKAYERKDFVLVADLVEFELFNLFDTWLAWANENLQKLELNNREQFSGEGAVDQSL